MEPPSPISWTRSLPPATRHGLWRQLWLALAESEQALGVPIPEEAIAQMRRHLDDIDFEAVATYERRFRHDERTAGVEQ